MILMVLGSTMWNENSLFTNNIIIINGHSLNCVNWKSTYFINIIKKWMMYWQFTNLVRIIKMDFFIFMYRIILIFNKLY